MLFNFQIKRHQCRPLMSPRFPLHLYVLAHNIALCYSPHIFILRTATSTAQQLSQLYPQIVVAIFFTIMANHLDLLYSALTLQAIISVENKDCNFTILGQMTSVSILEQINLFVQSLHDVITFKTNNGLQQCH
jgi:hypothetical protein